MLRSKSYLGRLRVKRMMKASTNQLKQVTNRLGATFSFSKHTPGSDLRLSKEHFDGPLPDSSTVNFKQYRLLFTCSDTFRLTSWFYKRNDSYVYDGTHVYRVCNILAEGTDTSSVLLVCKKFRNYLPFFDYPLTSSDLDIYVVDSVSNDYFVLPLSDVICKGIIIKISNKTVFIPLLFIMHEK